MGLHPFIKFILVGDQELRFKVIAEMNGTRHGSIFYPGDEALPMICVRQLDGPKPKGVDNAWWSLSRPNAPNRTGLFGW